MMMMGWHKSESPPERSAATEPTHGRSVLVVDDEEHSRKSVAKLLSLSGYHVRVAASVEEALEALGAGTFDAVVSDVNMPGHDGYELTEILRSQPETRDVPILLMSALAQPERQVRGLDEGADDFIAKPIDFDLLLARLRARLRTAEERAHLRQISKRDELTGALNRRGIETELTREVERARRTGLGVSVMMVDVDDFKRINDTWGHAAGDEALRVVVQALRARLRTVDRIGRIGGDEFLVVLSGAGVVEAGLLEKRVRTAFAKHPPRPGDVPTLVRISVGTATVDVPSDPTGEMAIRRADRAMYEDKARTR